MCLTLFGSTQLLGQEWSEEQIEVWAAIENEWEVATKGDVDGYRNNTHDDFSGWNPYDPLPWDKETDVKFYSYDLNQNKPKVLIYDIKPAEINVFDNVAIVHYFEFLIVETGDEKEQNISGRLTQIFKKEGDKWLRICEVEYAVKSD
jgi:ketosteroid isomerase-like protein